MHEGIPEVLLFPLFLWIPLIALLPVSILLYRREARNRIDSSFRERFRLKRPSRNDWLWAIGGIVIVASFDFILMDPVAKWMAGMLLFSPPEHFPVLFHPLKEIELPLSEFMGAELRGNWIVLISTILMHAVALIGEEFMWRGYLLPRQEGAHGRWAWLVNGLLWGYLLHFFMKWNFLSFLPSMLATPYIAQKTRNTWVSLLVHGVPNSILWILILSGVLGFG